MVDSLVPHVNQDLKGMYPDMPQELLQKVEQVVYPDFNHLTGVNGKGV